MPYEVHCECGKAHAVSAADAGTSLRCACGHTVDVPPLHQLRTARGREALSPLVQLRALVQNGLVPGTQDCVCCHCHTNNLLRVGIGCEQGSRGPSRAEVVGCLLAPCIGWVLALVMVVVSRVIRETSDDVSVVVPLPVCDACRPTLNHPAVLRQALRQIPEYATLLGYYPRAQVSLFG